MSKWITGFYPSRSGSYLVKTEMTVYIGKSVTYTRADYDSLQNKWIDRHGYSIFHSFSGDNYICYWWDEFKIAEEKRKLKLKF